MAIKFTVLFACILGSTVTGLPLGDEEFETKTYKFSEHLISGASGTFRYPLSGVNYENMERVTITANFPENTLFIIEDYHIEESANCYYDRLSLRQWSGNASDHNFCGSPTGPKYFKTENSFLLTFASDLVNTGAGFNLRWAPIEPLAV